MAFITPYKVIRSKRKTIALQVNSEAALIVRVPMRFSLNYVEQIIQQKHSWITKKQDDITNKINKFTAKTFEDSEKFLYLGKSYNLTFTKDQKTDLIFDNEFSIATNEKIFTRIILVKWYKKTALDHISKRIIYFAAAMGLAYKSVRLSDAKTLWGTCSQDNRLSFSWRLIMAPSDVIDYVVVHELSHIKHKNHSKQFWETVKNTLPLYQIHKKWLKENGHLLHWKK
ncbi:MAG: M48 family metallopeptidase [Rickettsiales bacterium]|jgi:predicted metal-dependent hydrolase|nr:M48 family metallopeptidase [Rickettsiales bacterium]